MEIQTEPESFKPPTDLIIMTAPFVSRYHVTRVTGATFGLIVRSRGLGQNVWAAVRSWGGGEVRVYAYLLEQVRHQAIQRLADHAKSLGANAVISVGFDTSEMGGVDDGSSCLWDSGSRGTGHSTGPACLITLGLVDNHFGICDLRNL